MPLPSSTVQWTVEGHKSFDDLHFRQDGPVPHLSRRDVLVHVHWASLNYRDLIIPLGKYDFPNRLSVVPGSDGAGTVVAVGADVKRFKAGDKVLTLFNQDHQGGAIDSAANATGLGGVLDGTLREYGVFDESGLVSMPSNLSFQEGSALPCAAVTAWNALFGLEGKKLQAGETVLVQGSGGVSVFGLQLAKASGARVIATTSSAAKATKLKQLGADHVINYKDDKTWGKTARGFTANDRGVDHIIEVGGPNTMEQSLEAIRMEGLISIIGFVGGVDASGPSTLQTLIKTCTIRGLMVGSRVQFEDMNRAIEVNDIHPVVDDTVFELHDLKEAYKYMWDQKHVGKLTVHISDPSD